MGFYLAVEATKYAALLAGVVLVANLLPRKWLSAGQMNLLWGLVLIRLLMPFAPASFLSLRNLTVPMAARSGPMDVTTWMEATPEERAAYHTGYGLAGYEAPAPVATVEQPGGITWQDIAVLCLSLAWSGGFVLVTGWTAIVNLRFSRRMGAHRSVMTSGSLSCGGPAVIKAGMHRAIPIVWCEELKQPAVMGALPPEATAAERRGGPGRSPAAHDHAARTGSCAAPRRRLQLDLSADSCHSLVEPGLLAGGHAVCQPARAGLRRLCDAADDQRTTTPPTAICCSCLPSVRRPVSAGE